MSRGRVAMMIVADYFAQVGFEAGVDHQLAEGLAVGAFPGDHLVTPALSDVAG